MFQGIEDMYGRRAADLVSGFVKVITISLAMASAYWSLVITENNNHSIVMQEINLLKQDQANKTEFVGEFKVFMGDLNNTLMQLNTTVATLNKHEEEQDRRIETNEKDIKALEAAKQ